MLGDPKSFKGGISWALLGLGGSLVALFVGSIFPRIIPARAAGVRL